MGPCGGLSPLGGAHGGERPCGERLTKPHGKQCYGWIFISFPAATPGFSTEASKPPKAARPATLCTSREPGAPRTTGARPTPRSSLSGAPAWARGGQSFAEKEGKELVPGPLASAGSFRTFVRGPLKGRRQPTGRACPTPAAHPLPLPGQASVDGDSALARFGLSEEEDQERASSGTRSTSGRHSPALRGRRLPGRQKKWAECGGGGVPAGALPRRCHSGRDQKEVTGERGPGTPSQTAAQPCKGPVATVLEQQGRRRGRC